MGYTFVDSGSMYRALTFHALESGISIADTRAMVKAANEIQLSFLRENQSAIVLNGRTLISEIRTAEVNAKVSEVAAITEVRREMVRRQQELGRDGGIVMDGRDIGTMVFPDAELKIFMTASLEVRTNRRSVELIEQGIHSPIDEIRENLAERDRIDSGREEGPLRKANGAVEIDSSSLTFEEQVDMIVELAKQLIG